MATRSWPFRGCFQYTRAGLPGGLRIKLTNRSPARYTWAAHGQERSGKHGDRGGKSWTIRLSGASIFQRRTCLVKAAMRSIWRHAPIALGLVLFVAGSARTAQAQNKSSGSIHLGAFFPTQSELKAETSDTWYALGVDFQPGFKYHPLGGNVHFGFDGVWHGSGASGG